MHPNTNHTEFKNCKPPKQTKVYLYKRNHHSVSLEGKKEIRLVLRECGM